MDVPASESYVTRLVHVENVDPNEVAQVLSRIKGEQGDIVVFAPQNALIITDLASNINRMMKILREIDQPGRGREALDHPPQEQAASEMAQKLSEYFSGGAVKKRGGAPPRPEHRARGRRSVI